MPPKKSQEDSTHDLAKVLSALADPVRLQIIGLLHERPDELGWGELEFDICKATLSHHVKKLRMAGLIDYRKEGTRCYLYIRKDFEKKFPGLLKAILKTK